MYLTRFVLERALPIPPACLCVPFSPPFFAYGDTGESCSNYRLLEQGGGMQAACCCGVALTREIPWWVCTTLVSACVVHEKRANHRMRLASLASFGADTLVVEGLYLVTMPSTAVHQEHIDASEREHFLSGGDGNNNDRKFPV
jgi:hypothetical protein